MGRTSGTGSKQFLVQKDNGEWWTVTYGGPKRVRWDRTDPPVEHEVPDEVPRYAEPTPADSQRAQEWGDFFAGLLIEALEELRPYIEIWLRDVVLPWAMTTAKSTWNRVIAKRSTPPIQVVTPVQVRITDFTPASAIALSERATQDDQAHRLNLTPEEAQKQLDDIRLLTKILAEKVRTLTSAVIREEGESEEMFLERRKHVEQLAVHNVTSNIQTMLEQGTDLAQAISLSANYTPVFAAGSVEAASLSIESPAQLQHRDQPRM